MSQIQLEPKQSHAFRNFIITILVLAVIGGGAYFGIKLWMDNNNISMPLTKEKPQIISKEQTLSAINVSVLAKANYNYVILQFDFLNDSDAIFSQGSVIKNNLTKDETYIFSHTLTINEHLNAKKYSVQIVDYR